MVDRKVAAIAVIVVLIAALFILVSPRGISQPETASNCPTGQYAASEDAAGNVVCAKDFNPNQILPQLAFTPITTFLSDVHTCSITSKVGGMAGFKMNYTTHDTGQINIAFTFLLDIPNGTSVSSYQMAYGTGTAPSCKAASTGTIVGLVKTISAFITHNGVSTKSFEDVAVYAARLSPSTTYWFDLLISESAFDTWTYQQPEITISETVNPLVGYWPLDEGTGTVAYDLSGNGNTGTLMNSPTWQSGANCKFGNCLQSHQLSNSFVRLGSISNLFGRSFTIIAWIKDSTPISSHTPEVMLGDRVLTDTWVNAWVESGRGTIAFEMGYNYPFEYTEFECPDTIHDGVYHMVSWVRNTGNSLAYIYIDGTLWCNSVFDSTASNDLTNNNLVQIGGGTGQFYPMNGTIDDVRIYNVALTSSQIAQLYAYGLEYHN